MKSMYTELQAAVKLPNGVTPYCSSLVGVRQGCNLSPMLFNLFFVNNIFDLFDNAESLAINSSAGPWLALANSVSKFIGCLGCQMSWQPGPAKEDSAFLASIIQWQFLAISADDRGFVGILSRWSLAILADGEEFVGTRGRWSRVLGIWSWISRQLSKNLSVFLADCLEFLGKVGQKFVSILGRWSRFCQ